MERGENKAIQGSARCLGRRGLKAARLSGQKCELGEARGAARLRELRTAAPGRGGGACKRGGCAAVLAHAQLVKPAQLPDIARLLLRRCESDEARPVLGIPLVLVYTATSNKAWSWYWSSRHLATGATHNAADMLQYKVAGRALHDDFFRD